MHIVLDRSLFEKLMKGWLYGTPPAFNDARALVRGVQPLPCTLAELDWALQAPEHARQAEGLRETLSGLVMRWDGQRQPNPDDGPTEETLRQSLKARNADPLSRMDLSEDELQAVRDIRRISEALGRGITPQANDTSRIIVDGGQRSRAHPVDRMTIEELWLHAQVYQPWAHRMGQTSVRGPKADNPRPTALEVVHKVLMDRKTLSEVAAECVVRKASVVDHFHAALLEFTDIKRAAAPGRQEWIDQQFAAA